MSLSCQLCQFQFNGIGSFRKHRCPLDLYVGAEPPDYEVSTSGVTQMTPLQIMNYCANNGLAVPGVHPLFFTPGGRNVCPVLEKLGCCIDPYEKLKVATEEGIVVIKKTIKIKINDQVLTIGPKFTIPTNKNKLRTMSVTHRGDHIIIETSNSQVMIFLLKANQVKILLCNSKRKLVPYNILMTSMIMTYL